MSSTPHSPQARLAALGLTLPPVGPPAGAYKPCLVVGRLAHVSGHLPVLPDGTRLRGRVGQDLDIAAGREAARLAGLAILATLVANLGSLDAVGRVVRMLGLVNCTPDFEQHPQVVNGCSELFAEIWGPDHGVGVRSAVGAASLPLGVPVEVEAVFELA